MRWTLVIAGLIAVALPETRSFAQDGDAPAFKKLRYEEDYSYLRDPARRSDWVDALKFIPADGNAEVYLSLGGEVRQRYEYTHDPLFGGDPQDSAGVWLQRYSLHGDLHLGTHLRLFGELSSALENGRAGGASPIDEDKLRLQKGFFDLGFSPLEGSELTFRGGRQELQFGSGRLVDVREGPNVRRTFDAGRVIFELPGWRVDGLVARPRMARPGVLDDRPDDDQSLWGLYATGGNGCLPFGSLDLYYLGYRNDVADFAQGTAAETRHSLGARLWGDSGNWDWNWEAVYQFGSFGDGDISAWTAATETGYTLPDLWGHPRLALSANVASGDDDPNNADLGTFNALFPRGNYFSEAAVLGPRNFFNLHPLVTVSPFDDFSVTTDANFFWRLETADGVYGPSGQLIRAADGSDKRFVGSAISVNAEWNPTKRLSFTAIYSHFFAGDFIRATGPSDDIDYVELTAQLRF